MKISTQPVCRYRHGNLPGTVDCESSSGWRMASISQPSLPVNRWRPLALASAEGAWPTTSNRHRCCWRSRTATGALPVISTARNRYGERCRASTPVR